MKKLDPQFKIRMPLELKEKLEKASIASGRSMNNEIIERLSDSFIQLDEFNNVSKRDQLKAQVKQAQRKMLEAVETLTSLEMGDLDRVLAKSAVRLHRIQSGTAKAKRKA